MIWTMPRRGLASLIVLTSVACAGDAKVAEQGRKIFSGEAPLVARVKGHDAALPSLASRCNNCYAASPAPWPTAGTRPPTAYGPELTREHLVNAHSRRGGPASVYDEAALCRLLRNGVDPAYVVVAIGMPRYELTDADCRALWIYLSRRST